MVFDFTGLELRLISFPLRVSIPCIAVSSVRISLEEFCIMFLKIFVTCNLYLVIICLGVVEKFGD